MTEVAAHLGVERIAPEAPYSLHTEYAAGKRPWSPLVVERYPVLATAHRGVPSLWCSDEWALAFADWLTQVVADCPPPAVIEIHPPFRKDCADLGTFVRRYDVFVDRVLSRFPDVQIVLENRSGSYLSQPFLVSTPADVRAFAEVMPASLRLCIDLPQLFTASCRGAYPTAAEIDAVFDELRTVWDKVFSLHLWGRRGGKAHVGDLASLFDGDVALMGRALTLLQESVGDRVLYLVPEVNSGVADMERLLDQVESAGIGIG
jgi:hypothetical protein